MSLKTVFPEEFDPVILYVACAVTAAGVPEIIPLDVSNDNPEGKFEDIT